MKLIYLSAGEKLKEFRRKQYDAQNGICPILKKKIKFSLSCVDHLHGKKNDLAGTNGSHLVRGVIHNFINIFEGRVNSAYKRSGLSKLISLPDLLRNLADYIESPPLFGSGYVHPAGKPKRKTIGKRDFSRIQKYWKQIYPKRKMPVWKEKLKKGKKIGKMSLTKPIKEALDEANKIHYSKYK